MSRHAWEAVGDSTLLDADIKLKSAAGKQNDNSPDDTWIFLTQDECSALDGALHLMMGDAEVAATYWKDTTPFGAPVFMTEAGGVKLSDLSTEIPNMRGILGRLNQAEAASQQAEYDKQQREQAEAARRQAEQERQRRVVPWIVLVTYCPGTSCRNRLSYFDCACLRSQSKYRKSSTNSRDSDDYRNAHVTVTDSIAC